MDYLHIVSQCFWNGFNGNVRAEEGGREKERQNDRVEKKKEHVSYIA